MKQSLKKITLIGLFSALVFVGTMIKIDISLAFSNTMVHLGNAVCIICGIFLGPIYGGIAAGFGSFLFDVFSPIFITSAPFSFVFKFCLAFVSAKIYNNLNKFEFLPRFLSSATLGCFAYIFLHISKVFIYNICFLKLSLNTVFIIVIKNLFVSLINTFVSIFISFFLVKNLRNVGIFENQTGK